METLTLPSPHAVSFGRPRSKTCVSIPQIAPRISGLPPYQVIDNRTVFSWNDNLTSAVGWIVIDSPKPTVAGGGLFMHDKATLQEVTDVATTMSYKLTVSSQPHVVGAKGGIRFNHRDPSAAGVLERFIRDNAAVISRFWGTGGDLNTSHSAIDRHLHRHAGLECALAPIAHALASPMSMDNMLSVLRSAIPMHGTTVSLEEASVGYGAAVAFRKLLRASAPHRMGSCRFLLQGLGTVGATFAHYIREFGLGYVVGISSQYGYVVNQEGIDVDKICSQRCLALAADPSIDSKLLESGLTADEMADASFYAARRSATTDGDHLCDFLRLARADVFAPCAGRYVLSQQVLRTLSSVTFENVPYGERFIVAGANNVFHPEQNESAWLSALDADGISMLPEWITNSGTSSIFMRACSGAFSVSRPEALLRACGRDCENFLEQVCVTQQAATGVANAAAFYRSSELFRACYRTARKVRRRGPLNRLGVERIAHLSCITSEAGRAYETFTQILGALPIAGPAGVTDDARDVRYLRLPGADDPTLSVADAGPDATIADTGLSVCFAVTNLAKTRSVLEKDGIPFVASKLGELGDVLQLNGSDSGYPMSFVESSAQYTELAHQNPEGGETVLQNVGVKKMDHYTIIVPDADAVKKFHEVYMGYSHLRTISLNAGSAPREEDDMLNHVLALPNDKERVLVVTEGLNPASVFSRLLDRKHRPYVHHMAMQVTDVQRAFELVRAAEWGTTADAVSHDMLSGLQQFFLCEEEAGCFLELIERANGRRKAGITDGTELTVEDEVVEQGDFKKGNMASLAQSMESYVSA